MRARFAPVALGVALFAIAAPARAEDTDPWWGPDKALHFGISAGLAGTGYGVSALFLDSRAERAVAGASFSLVLGAGKETWDLLGHGDPSWKDFTWDVAGTAVGVGIALLVDLAIRGSSPNQPTGTRTVALRF